MLAYRINSRDIRNQIFIPKYYDPDLKSQLMALESTHDLLEIGENEEKRMDFVKSVINWHTTTDLYKTAQIADDYFCKRNRTILEYQKFLTKLALL